MEAEVGIVPDPIEDSADLEAQGSDTPEGEGHTPEGESRTVDDLIEELRQRHAEIPPEKLQFLNPNLQQGFTRRLNLLNRSIEPVAKKMLDDAGVDLPPGKTVMDLLTDGDGKEFFRIWDAHQAKRMEPVLAHVEQQKMAQQIQEWSGYAQREFPIVKEHFEEASRLVANDPDLVEMAKTAEWRGLPYVMQGAAYKIAYDKAAAKITELQKLLDAAKVAKKTGPSTSLAGGPSEKGEKAGKVDLDTMINRAWKQATESQ